MWISCLVDESLLSSRHFIQLNPLAFVQYIEFITHKLRFIDKDNMIWYNIIKRIQFFIKEGYFKMKITPLVSLQRNTPLLFRSFALWMRAKTDFNVFNLTICRKDKIMKKNFRFLSGPSSIQRRVNMKKLFIMGIALILMCSVAFSLYSCEIEDDSDKQSSQTENESLFETNSKSNSNS